MNLLSKLTFGLLTTVPVIPPKDECITTIQSRIAYVNILYNKNCVTVDSIREYDKQSIPFAAYYTKSYVLAHNGPGNIFVFKNGFQKGTSPVYTNRGRKYASNSISNLCYANKFFVFTIASDSRKYKLVAINCLTNKVSIISKDCNKEFCIKSKGTLQYHINELDKSLDLSSL